MILPIFVYGSSVLREPVKPIDKSYPELQALIANMFETMHGADGVGIAAPQVGLSIDLFCIDLTPYADEFPEDYPLQKVFINSEIYELSDEEISLEEGCLSLPGINEKVVRPEGIRIRYFDENFAEHDRQITDFEARVIQHEYDHVNGQVFTDHLNPLRKNLVKSKLSAMSKGKYSAKYRCKQTK